MKNKFYFCWSVLLVLVLTIFMGCASTPTPLQLQSIETKTIKNASLDSVYNACRTVFMNYGYIVEDCEKDSGFILMTLDVPEKDVITAGLLGFLPGGGSFYTRRYGAAIISIVFYPWSIMWDGPNAMTEAELMIKHVKVSISLTTRGNNVAMRMGFRNVDRKLESYGQFVKRFYAEVERKTRIEQNIDEFMSDN
jgi:hypothetical protein